ncbi:hypothetical protein L1281_002547 [Neisseria sp. HSC-16F19]|nr:hypothetical protein [Neisseria sp. HSC-16F19]MCP2041929.1 hypothetical protein [Neisseria sp. HSC-16F19]
MDVQTGKRFEAEFKNFPHADKIKISKFILHVQKNGFKGLPGRNKPSDDVPPDDPNWLEKVRYAQRYNLWHYHIGIPEYTPGCTYGDMTSKYVIHYIKGEGFIKIVDFSEHPPFKPPTEPYLKD